MLTFNAQKHEYRWNGAVVPSVTQILKPMDSFEGIPEEILDNARIRGDWVHKATELIDLGMPVTNIPEEYAPYIEAFKRYRAESGNTPLLLEQRVFCEKHQYAGTLDRMEQVKRSRAIMDIKVTFELPMSVGAQTAAYLNAFNEKRPKNEQATKRFSLRLKKDGTYEFTELKDAVDLVDFLSCLNIYNCRKRHGKL